MTMFLKKLLELMLLLDREEVEVMVVMVEKGDTKVMEEMGAREAQVRVATKQRFFEDS